MAPARRAGKLVEGRAFDSCEGTHDLEKPNGVENLLDHLRTRFKPIEVFRRGGRIVDDFVYDFERQPGEKIRQGLRDEIQHFVETLRGSGWTSESFDQDTRARTCNGHPAQIPCGE